MKAFQLGICVSLLAAVPAFAETAAQMEANKKLAQKFFQSMGNMSQLTEIIHPDYIQHNPMFLRFNEENGVSGREGLKKFLASRGGGPGGKKGPPPGAGGAPPTHIYTAEGDLVTVISGRSMMDKEGTPYTAYSFDTWRVKDGKLYEHWDGARLPPQ